MALTEAQQSALLQSGLFDATFYLERNYDVATSPHEPLVHYVNWGADENRSPSLRFDPRFYASQCQVRGFLPGNCLVHYLGLGQSQGLVATPTDYTLKEAGVPLLDLIQQFESLGRDCEFGLFQKTLGAEPNDLFRFADPSPEMLAKLIRSDFFEYGEHFRVALDESRPRREWFIVDEATNISRHTRIFEGDMPKEKVQNAAVVWTRLLRAKTVRDLAGGQKIYVIKSSEGIINENSVLSLAQAIRSKGKGWLLWVEAGVPLGHCQILAEGLIRASIDRLCPLRDEANFSIAGWLTVLCAAWNAVQAQEA